MQGGRRLRHSTDESWWCRQETKREANSRKLFGSTSRASVHITAQRQRSVEVYASYSVVHLLECMWVSPQWLLHAMGLNAWLEATGFQVTACWTDSITSRPTTRFVVTVPCVLEASGSFKKKSNTPVL